jgi:hypothetical protein
LVQLASPFTLAFISAAHVTTPRKRRDTGIDVAASHRGSLIPMLTLMPLGFLEGCQMNLKPEIKLQQDLNQYSFGGPP